MEEELNNDTLKRLKILETYTLRELKQAIIKMKANYTSAPFKEIVA